MPPPQPGMNNGPPPSTGVPIGAAEMIGTVIEGVLYGIYLVFFPSSLFVLFHHTQHRDRPVKVNRLIFVAAWVLFASVTAHWVIDVYRIYTAFVTNSDTASSAERFFMSMEDPRNVTRTWLFTVEMLTLDSLLLYRLFIIWSRKFWVLIPAGLALIGTTVGSIGLNIIISRGSKDPGSLGDIQKWTLLPFIMSLCTNVLAVSFIAYRILKRDRALRSTGARTLSSILLVIVESAALYCIVTLAALVCTVSLPNVAFIFIDVMSPITGISFSLIILRVGLVRSLRSTAGQPTQPPSMSFPMQVRVTRDDAFTVTDADLARAAARDAEVSRTASEKVEKEDAPDDEHWAWRQAGAGA